MDESNLARSFNIASTLLSLILPVMQLGVLFAQNNPLLFLDNRAIVPTSVITLIFSILVILLSFSFPFIRFPLNKTDEEKYQNFLKKIDPNKNDLKAILKEPVVLPPLYITHDLLSFIGLLTSAISGFLYLILGLSIKGSNLTYVVLQSLFYLLFVSSTSYVIFNILFKQKRLDDWEIMRSGRAKKAVDLALDHSSIKEIPVIRIISSVQSLGYPQFLTTNIEVKNAKYELITDVRSNELFGIRQITNGR